MSAIAPHVATIRIQHDMEKCIISCIFVFTSLLCYIIYRQNYVCIYIYLTHKTKLFDVHASHMAQFLAQSKVCLLETRMIYSSHYVNQPTYTT